MTPYYEGTSEAEHLIRGSPELAEPWLKKAKQDRNRLAIRLFQPRKREFLDGFIKSLEVFLANRKERGERPADAPVVASRPGEVAPPVVAGGVPGDAPPQVIGGTSAADLGRELGPEPIGPETGSDFVVATQEMADPLPECAEAKVEVEAEDKTVETVATNEQADPLAGRQEIDAAAELALGVMKLSGWTVDVDPHASEPDGGDDLTANGAGEILAQTGGPVPSVAWNRVFEQARGVGMVDLSAYDFIDGLGELRELIDHWQNLHQEPSSGDAP